MNGKHYTISDIEKIKNNFCSTEEKIAFLEHINSCDDCLMLFTESFSENSLMNIPFKEPNPVMRIKYERKRKTEKIKYNIRTIIVTAAAVICVLSVPLDFIEEANRYIKDIDIRCRQVVVDKNKKINFNEVHKYEYEKKKK